MSKFLKLTIKARLYTIMVFFMSVLILLYIWNSRSYEQIQNKFDVLKTKAVPQMLYALEVRTAVFQIQQWLTDASATGWRDGFDEAEKWAKIYHENINAILQLGDEETKAMVNKMDADFGPYYEVGKTMANAYINQSREAGNRTMKEFDGVSQKMGDNVKALQLHMKADMDNDLKALSNQLEANQRSQMLITLLVILVGGGMVLMVIFSITRQIGRMMSEIKGIEENGTWKLNRRLSSDSNDELGTLGKIMNNFISHIAADLVQETKLFAQSVVNTAGGLRKNIEHNAHSLENMNQVSQDIAEGASKQKEDIDEMKTSVEAIATLVSKAKSSFETQMVTSEKSADLISEISRAINSITEDVNRIASFSVETSGIAKTGKTRVEESVSSMEQIHKKVADISTQIEKLSLSSDQIGKIIGVITEIASQTNLLALNAAIEAARAGEAGKGFAVVADEVRKLAERSGEAASEITTLIEEIQQVTSLSVASMAEGITEVNNGMETAEKAKNSLDDILGAVEKNTEQIQNISAVAQEISASATEVVSTISHLQQEVQGTSSEITEIEYSTHESQSRIDSLFDSATTNASASEELFTSVETVSQTAIEDKKMMDTLDNQVHELSKQLSKFET